MTQVADAFVRFLAETKDMQRTLGPNGEVVAEAEKGSKTAADRFKTNFTRASTAAGAAAGAIFVGAIGGATAFEDQLRTINTVAGLTDEELAGVGKSILDLSRETGKGTDDLTAGFYDLVSAGVPAKDAINVLRDSAIFATGALGTTGEAVDVVTSALNAYGLEASESGRVTDIFAKAVADGKVTAAELGSSIANIAPIAASAGISLEEVSTGFAVLTAKGVPAAQAATQMRAAISALLTPNEQLNKIQAETGINFAELAKAEGLAVALEELRKATGGNADAFAKSLGSVEAYQFALGATGENAADFATELGKVETASKEGGVATGQYEEQMKSAASQGKKLVANVKALGIEIGGPFVSSVGPAVAALGQMGTGLGGIFSLSKLVGGGIGALGGRLLALLLPAILGLIPAAVGAATSVGAAIAAAIPVGMALLPVLLVAAVVAAVAFLIMNPEIVAQIAGFVTSVLESIVEFLSALPGILLDVFSAAFGAIVQAAPGFIMAVAIEILKLPFRILDLQVKLLEFFAGIATNILGGIAQLIANIVGFFVKLPGRIAELAPKVLALFVQIGQNVRTTVSALAAAVVAFVLSIPSRVVGLASSLATFFAGISRTLGQAVSTLVGNIVSFFLSIPGKISELGGRIVRGIIGGMASLPGKLANVIADAFRNLRIDIGPFHISGSGISIDLPNISLPSFDVGSSFVPRDMLAAVHRGEIIVPADESEAIRSGRLALGTPSGRALSVSAGDTVVVNLYGIGSDVSDARARTFGQRIADETAASLRVQRARVGVRR